MKGREGEGLGFAQIFQLCVLFLLIQQVDAVIAASKSVVGSQNFKKVLEVRCLSELSTALSPGSPVHSDKQGNGEIGGNGEGIVLFKTHLQRGNRGARLPPTILAIPQAVKG